MLIQPLTVIWQRFETVVPCIWKVSCRFLFFLCKFPAVIEMVNLTSLCALSHLMYTAVGHLGFWSYLGKGFVALCCRNKTQPGSKRMWYTQGQCPSWFLLPTVVPCKIPPYQLRLQEEYDKQAEVQPSIAALRIGPLQWLGFITTWRGSVLNQVSCRTLQLLVQALCASDVQNCTGNGKGCVCDSHLCILVLSSVHSGVPTWQIQLNFLTLR